MRFIYIISIICLLFSCEPIKHKTENIEQKDTADNVLDTSYFPKQLLEFYDSDKSIKYEDVYSESTTLNLQKEPKLYSNDTIDEYFRLTWLGSRNGAVCISLIKCGSEAILRLKVLELFSEIKDTLGLIYSGEYTFDKEKVYAYYYQKEIKNKEFWSTFEYSIDKSNFWDWRSLKQPRFKSNKMIMRSFCTGGSFFILEGIDVKNGNDYHFIKRHSCDIEDSKYLECCMMLINWTNYFK